MRIYASINTTLKKGTEDKKNLLKTLEPYYYETRNLNYIWSPHNSDLYQIENNKIYYIRQRLVKDKVKTLLGAFPVTLDKSEYIKEDECYQIPPQSRSEFLRHKVYKRTPDSLTEWIFVYEGDQFKESYFYVPAGEDINAPGIKEELLWGLAAPSPPLSG